MRSIRKSWLLATALAMGLTGAGGAVSAAEPTAGGGKSCPASAGELLKALRASIKPTTGGKVVNGGLELHMWASAVNHLGVVCAVVFSGDDLGDQWLGSRVISAQKAYTANAFSLDGLALSTANLYSAVQPGGSLYGLQHSNPIDTKAAYADGKESPSSYGSAKDPMLSKTVGGVNVFGGGLATYKGGAKTGAIGVSGDTSCADHNIAWRVRQALGLAPGSGVGGVGPSGTVDGINYDIGKDGKSAGGFGHPTCIGTEPKVAKSIGAGG